MIAHGMGNLKFDTITKFKCDRFSIERFAFQNSALFCGMRLEHDTRIIMVREIERFLHFEAAKPISKRTKTKRKTKPFTHFNDIHITYARNLFVIIANMSWVQLRSCRGGRFFCIFSCTLDLDESKETAACYARITRLPPMCRIAWKCDAKDVHGISENWLTIILI